MASGRDVAPADGAIGNPPYRPARRSAAEEREDSEGRLGRLAGGRLSAGFRVEDHYQNVR